MNFNFFWIYKVFLFVNGGLFKVLLCSNLVTHIKLYIFWKNSLNSTQKCKIKSFKDILSNSRGLSKWQNFENLKFRGLELSVQKNFLFKFLSFWKNKSLSFWKLWEYKTGLFLFRKALQVMILFRTQINNFLPENQHLHNQKALT